MEKELLDDEVDLMAYARVLWDYRKWLLWILVGSFVMSLFVTAVMPKRYTSTTTFFMPSPESGGGGGMGRGAMGALGYSTFFSAGDSDSFSSYLMSLFESRKIKTLVAIALKPYVLEKEFVATKDGMTEEDTIAAVLAFLALKRVAIREKGVINTLSYSHTEPEITVRVIQAYIEAFSSLNRDLDLSSQKEIIRILDDHELPLRPSSPNPLKNMVFFLFGGTLVWGAFVFGREAFFKFRNEFIVS